MLLDTDTDPSAIDDRLVRRLKLRPLGKGGRGQGVGSGSVQVTPYVLSSVSIGSVQARRVAALGSDLAPLAHAFGHRIDGVVGRSFLNPTPLMYNYVNGLAACGVKERSHRIR